MARGPVQVIRTGSGIDVRKNMWSHTPMGVCRCAPKDYGSMKAILVLESAVRSILTTLWAELCTYIRVAILWITILVKDII